MARKRINWFWLIVAGLTTIWALLTLAIIKAAVLCLFGDLCS